MLTDRHMNVRMRAILHFFINQKEGKKYPNQLKKRKLIPYFKKSVKSQKWKKFIKSNDTCYCTQSNLLEVEMPLFLMTSLKSFK